jgi:hypothetical protein
MARTSSGAIAGDGLLAKVARMKTSHAAALALVGWYLMTPPPDNLKAPISQWEINASYDTAEQCSLEQGVYFNTGMKQRKQKLGNLRAANEAMLRAQCIATDDPRLKEK